MSIKVISIDEVDLTLVYTTCGELARETGMSHPGVRKYLINDTINGFIIDKNKDDKKHQRGRDVFIYPSDAEKFKAMVRAGLVKAKKAKK